MLLFGSDTIAAPRKYSTPPHDIAHYALQNHGLKNNDISVLAFPRDTSDQNVFAEHFEETSTPRYDLSIMAGRAGAPLLPKLIQGISKKHGKVGVTGSLEIEPNAIIVDFREPQASASTFRCQII